LIFNKSAKKNSPIIYTSPITNHYVQPQ